MVLRVDWPVASDDFDFGARDADPVAGLGDAAAEKVLTDTYALYVLRGDDYLRLAGIGRAVARVGDVHLPRPGAARHRACVMRGSRRCRAGGAQTVTGLGDEAVFLPSAGMVIGAGSGVEFTLQVAKVWQVGSQAEAVDLARIMLSRL